MDERVEARSSKLNRPSAATLRGDHRTPADRDRPRLDSDETGSGRFRLALRPHPSTEGRYASGMTEHEATSTSPVATETAPPSDRAFTERWTDGRWLLLIAACALVIRLVWMWLHGAVIENEGAAYARLAENLLAGRGYIGDLGGRDTLFPPLYPMAIALASGLAGNAELAARLLSCVSGVLVIWPVYGITRYLGGRSAALIAATLAAGSGVLVALSGSAYSESIYFLLLLSGIYFSCRVLAGGSLRDATAAGVFFGCAYLVRPEALAYACLAVAFVGGHAFATRRPWRQTAARIGALGASVVLLAAPYVAWLSLNSGYFRWEGKSLINGIVSDGISRGMTYQEAARGLGPNLERLGPYLTGDQFAIAAPNGTGPGLISVILTDTLPRLVEFARDFASPSAAGGPALTLLAMVGLLVSLLDKRNRAQKLFYAATGAAYVVILLSLAYRWDRFLFPLTLLALPWAAIGISGVANLLVRQLARSARAAPRRWPAFASVATVAVAALSILSFGYAGGAGEFTQSTAQDLKSAGLWLRDRQPTTVMGMGSVVSYYAGATEVYLPWAQEDTALRYIHAVQPDFIYLRHGDEPQAPYVERWLADGIPDRCAIPVQAFSQAGGGQLTVFKWQC